MKRIMVLALAFVLAVGSMAVPSYAAEADDGQWIELLDYGSVTSSGNLFTVNDVYTTSLTMPGTSALYYVDLVFSNTGSFLSSINVSKNGQSFPLTIDKLSYGFYRAYGYLTPYDYSSLSIVWDSPDVSYITLHSCRVSQVNVTPIYQDVNAFLAADTDWVNFSYSPGGQGYAEVQIPVASSSYAFSSGFKFPSWRKFDYIDLSLSFFGCASINSIVARLDNPDGSPGGTYLDVKSSIISQSFYADGYYEIVVRIDLSSVSRGLDVVPVLLIDGETDGSYMSLTINECRGFVVVDTVDSTDFWLTKILDKVSSGFNSVVAWFGTLKDTTSAGFNSVLTWFGTLKDTVSAGITTLFNELDSGFSAVVAWFRALNDMINTYFLRVIELLEGKDAQDMQQDVQDQIDDFEHMDDVINSVTVPDVDNIDTDISGFVSTDQLTSVQDVFGRLFGIQFLMDFVSLSLILGLGSFLVYGRKD